MDAKKQNRKKGNGKKNASNDVEASEDASGYFRWILEMDRDLADILRDERSLGHKSDGGWKPVAYNTASSILLKKFSVPIIADKVKHRVKLWKKWYGVVTDILGQSGFNWDDTKHMLTIDDENAWKDYVKTHPDAKGYRFKVIPNWDDVVDICAKDRAIGKDSENGIDADETMSNEEIDVEDLDVDGIDSTINSAKKKNAQCSTSTTLTPKKRTRSQDDLSSAISKMAESFQHYILKATPQKADVKEVMDELNGILNLDRQLRLKALDLFMENERKFLILKNLPADEKIDYILMLIP